MIFQVSEETRFLNHPNIPIYYHVKMLQNQCPIRYNYVVIVQCISNIRASSGTQILSKSILYQTAFHLVNSKVFTKFQISIIIHFYSFSARVATALIFFFLQSFPKISIFLVFFEILDSRNL